MGLAVSVLVAIIALTAQAQAQTSQLAQYVPADAGLYLELDDLPTALTAYTEGPLYARMDQSPAWVEWKESELPNVQALQNSIAAALNLSWESISTDILGGQVAVAVWPSQQATAESGTRPGNTLVLLRAKKAASLQPVSSGFRRLQRSMGIEWTKEESGGVDVHIGTDLATQQVKFAHAVVDETAILADSKQACLRALALLQAKPEEPSLADLD